MSRPVEEREVSENAWCDEHSIAGSPCDECESEAEIREALTLHRLVRENWQFGEDELDDERIWSVWRPGEEIIMRGTLSECIAAAAEREKEEADGL